MGSTGLCAVLIVSAVLRWLAPQSTREKRLNRLALLAGIVLVFIVLFALREPISNAFAALAKNDIRVNEEWTPQLIHIVIETIRLFVNLLLIGAAAAATVVLISVLLLFLGYSLQIVFRSGKKSVGQQNGEKTAENRSDTLQGYLRDIRKRFRAIINSPVIISAMALGVLALFIAIPVLLEAPDGRSLGETWKSGVHAIASILPDTKADEERKDTSKQGAEEAADPKTSSDEKSNKNSSGDDFKKDDVLKYILLFIIMLGILFSVFRLIRSIIKQSLAATDKKDFLEEYSGTIGVLAVGVAILWTLKDGAFFLESRTDLLVEFFKTFCTVMVIIALIVLTLEIIRLLLDMREKLIRQEAKLLFISLIGRCSLLMFSMFRMIYQGINSAMGNRKNEDMEKIQDKIESRMTQAMEWHLLREKEYKRTFSGFDETVTKNDGEEEF